jgi:transmembrane sensor
MREDARNTALDPALIEASQWLVRLREQPSSAELSAFRVWLAASPDHSIAMEAATAAWTVAGRAPSLLQPIHRSYRRAYGALAATLLLVCAAGVVWLQERNPDRHVYRTGLGERLDVALADGSTLKLDAETEVETRISWLQRRVRVGAGEVRLDVRPERWRAFDVDAGALRVHVTGTSFVVAQQPNRSSVLLVAGKISVVDPANGQALQHLVPGQKATWTQAAPGRVAVQQADVAAELARLAGQLVFKRTRLDEAIGTFATSRKVPVEFASDDIARLEISGVFAAADFNAFLDAVVAIHPVTRTARSDGTIALAWRNLSEKSRR